MEKWREYETTRAYEYDRNGSLTDKIEFARQGESQLWSTESRYEYNGSNQLVRVLSESGLSEYSYYPGGLRSSKRVSGETTRFVYHESRIIAELGEDYGLKASNLFGSGILFREAGSKTISYLTDGHGDVVGLSDAFGKVTNRKEYEPFGKERQPEATGFGKGILRELQREEADGIDTPFGYCGEYLDEETGFIYLRARYYSPDTGRFVSEDPIRDGLNWYTYCVNNPIGFTDPSGLQTIPLRTTIEGLGGTVSWDEKTKTALVNLDGQSAKVYAGDKNGSFISINDDKMYTDDAWLFAALAYTFDLGKGWTGRIEQHGTGNGYQKHVVLIDKHGTEHAQNEDGSPHDKGGNPPNSIKKKLKSQEGWDWNQKDADWQSKIETIVFDSGVIIKYPNGRKVVVYNSPNAYSMPFYPSEQDYRDYYHGPNQIGKDGKYGAEGIPVPFYPMPNHVPIYIPASIPITVNIPTSIPVPVYP